jgi:hypothetical protein
VEVGMVVMLLRNVCIKEGLNWLSGRQMNIYSSVKCWQITEKKLSL